MKSSEIRSSFLDFFAARGHRLEPSAPLVPHGDATLLFTNAGMVPFKDHFLGLSRPPAPRAVSVQKCMRVSGKHNDLENVGPSHRHHTFFEMLGNFSFGDYFKEEAIRFGYDLVTGTWGIAHQHLFATVFEDDDEAAQLWTRVAGLPAERVLRCGAQDNFWAMGDVGPCGPCSEIFVDLEPGEPAVAWQEGTDSGRYLEIWNLVFMQFDRREGGELVPLPRPSVDTGAGLERVAAVLQGVSSNYDSDLFRPLIEVAADLAETRYEGGDSAADVALRVIADHLRAVTFLLADGVIPSNEGRGYVLRRILRRAVRHGMGLGFDEPFLHRLVGVVGEVLGAAYPELAETGDASRVTVEAEEAKFLDTVAAGSGQIQRAIEEARAAGRGQLAGDLVFRLYDTFGVPLELVREIAEEERFAIDEEGFERELERQRSRSRAERGGTEKRLAAVDAALDAAPETRYAGYGELAARGEVEALVLLEGEAARRVERLEAGDRGVAVLSRSPFYAEAGGQLGDRGVLAGPAGEAEVLDTVSRTSGRLHLVRMVRGTLAEGETVEARVDAAWRRPTERNHTATHLLHAALRRVLGAGVRQAGSLVAPDRLRFDFTFGRPLEAAELERVEALVNRWVIEAHPTQITDGRSYDEAIAAGAMALFGEKYGDTVRTVEVPALAAPDLAEPLSSLELCGGCHVRNTGEIGLFVIVTERGIASGVRRIEARTGEAAREYLLERAALARQAAVELGVGEDRLALEVAQLAARLREAERELKRLRLEAVTGTPAEDAGAEVDGIRLVVREVPPAPAEEIRGMADTLRGRLGSGVVVLAARDDARVSLVTAVSKDLTDRLHAGRLAGQIAALVGGRGGGRPDFAQAGGREPDKLPQALGAVPELVREGLREP